MGDIEVEWNRPMERSCRASIAGEEVSVRQKGRCRKCWGSVVGRTDERNEFTGIKCRVCGRALTGTEAKAEADRMDSESLLNMMRLGSNAARLIGFEEGAMFAWKIFPELERMSDEELRSHVGRHSARRSGWLTREGFPEGSPSYFYLQAVELMAAVECLLRFEAVARFPEAERTEDGSIAVAIDEYLQPFSDDPQFPEREMMRRLGSTMSSGMLSAFACELAIKAICLTANGEAKKTHDLMALYCRLPEASRNRLVADLHDIEEIISDSRHVFGPWRYFEQSIGESAMRGLIDTQRAWHLGKAARVLLDEGNIMGLGCDVTMDAEQRGRFAERGGGAEYRVKVRLAAREGPPR